MAAALPNFDPIARAYRWLEYLSFGPMLAHCRFSSLPELVHSRRALVFGDGDGRFLARLLTLNPHLTADVVDSSAEMLRLLEQRICSIGAEARERITLHHAGALSFAPPKFGYDLVVTHFFLDCFSTEQLAALFRMLRPHLSAGALWALSDFAIPPGPIAAVCGRLLVAGLYRSFGLLTGLRTRTLPEYRGLFEDNGFTLCQRKTWLRGLLAGEVWRLTEPPPGRGITLI
ncbi:MAG TPA: class I SAM-dependent methyltransferase [Acidisarcina sp.]|nr:class I SAM-dependent methyltransferase [Acidisarcina sp.]